MILTQKRFHSEAGEQAVIWINPTRVNLHTGTKWPVGKYRLAQMRKWLPAPLVNIWRPAVKKCEPFAIPGRHFGTAVAVNTTPRYRKVADFIANMDTPSTSQWYRDLSAELAQTGLARHKKIKMQSEAEILDFLNDYVAALITSLKTKGYSDPQGGFESTAVINAEGAICKAGSGNHRFNMAHALGIDRFPLVIVGIHEAWFRAQSAHVETSAALDLIKAAEEAHQ